MIKYNHQNCSNIFKSHSHPCSLCCIYEVESIRLQLSYLLLCKPQVENTNHNLPFLIRMALIKVCGTDVLVSICKYTQKTPFDLYAFKEDKHFKDLTILCKDGKVLAHKFVLAQHSEFLRKHFSQNETAEHIFEIKIQVQVGNKEQRRGSSIERF